jgi:hypothetical protein
MDADSTHPELWKQAGLAEDSFGFSATDFRLVHAGPIPYLEQPRRRRARRARPIVLRSHNHAVWAGGQVRLRGKIRGTVPAGARVRIELRTNGRWRRLRRKPVEANGTFASHPRVARVPHASRRGAHRALALKNVRLRRGIRVLRLRAVVGGVGRSNLVRVRVRR